MIISVFLTALLAGLSAHMAPQRTCPRARPAAAPRRHGGSPLSELPGAPPALGTAHVLGLLTVVWPWFVATGR